ncbi:MAG: 50S ribosomal protein L11 methyltransferase [Lentimicrobium sp.]|nr:50S ribosomal protein L11 methyltransferase [Lentimicrobium sp.]
MDYIELNCSLPAEEVSYAEVIMAALGELGFESFEETENGLLAYIRANAFTETILNNETLWPEGANPSYTWQIIKDQNWNAVWESNFEPVIIDNRCLVRAPFHPEITGMEFDIVIEPKMSFGTAHHETTAQVILLMMNTNIKGKSLLDMGCGTGILAILGAMKGASDITAIDNDDWAYRNSLENIEKNKMTHIHVYHGDVSLLAGRKFDIIIANINRNILLRDLEQYCNTLNRGGILIMSGFYCDDVETINDKAESLGLTMVTKTERNNWAAVHYELK